MPSVNDVKLQVAASVDQTQRALAGLRGVTDQLDEALSRLRLTALGTAHPALADAISRLEQAKIRLEEAASLARAGADSADSYRALA
ncbi:MAG TPA: hypothetical protein VHI50_15505 [Micromonosporaceae bacterium]|nr:hypothetical protein [Micromonosporaceae bacterium]